MVETEITIDMGKIKFLIFLVFISIVAFLEISVTLNSPIAFGDEGLMTSISRWMGTKLDYPVFMPQVGTNIYKNGFFRSPLWNMLQGSFYFLFGFNDIFAKVLVPFVALLTALAVYALAAKLYSNDIALMAGVITIVIPSFITYSILLYSDMLLTLFMTLAVFTTILAFKTNRRKYIFLAGMFGGLSILADAAGFAILPFLILALIYDFVKRKNFKEVLRFWLPAIVIFIVIVTPYFLRNIVYYKTISCQFGNIFNTSNCYVHPDYKPQYNFEGLFTTGSQTIEFLTQGTIGYFTFSYGYPYFVPLLAIAGLVLAAYRRETKDIILIISLLVFLLIFYQSLPGRTEDMARNLVSSTAIVAVLAATYANEIGEFLKKYYKGFMWAVIFFVVGLSFLMARDKINSLVSVKQFIPSFFDACTWVKQNTPQDAIILSFNTAPTIYNCNRQAEWDLSDGSDIILSQNVTLMKERLHANGFTYIFVQKFSVTPQKISAGYWTGFVDTLTANPNSFKIVFENGPKYGSPEFQTCINSQGCDPGEVIYQIIY